jgi:hypothetical protein
MSVFLTGLALVSGTAVEAEQDAPRFELSGSLRYRFAAIDDAAFADTATASTYQLLVKGRFNVGNGFSAVLEGRHVGHIGPDDFNDTLNGKTQFPTEVDPDATEVSEAYLTYSNTAVSAWAGRQKIDWGNRRFVSNLGWRQNEMSFDGGGIEFSPSDTLTVRYQYAFNVNRPQSDDSPVGDYEGDFHLANLVWTPNSQNTLTTYAYDFDFDPGFAQNLSSRTFGANWTGTAPITDSWNGKLIVEVAQQSDTGNNANSFTHDYARFEGQLNAQAWQVRAGREILNGDGTSGFSTPFGLLHAYNGFADRFISTPANGLSDTYVGAKFTAPEDAVFGGATLGLTYHDFDSDNGDQSYGSEWDAVLSVPVRDNTAVQFKVADYQADSFSSDVTKIWVQVRVGF